MKPTPKLNLLSISLDTNLVNHAYGSVLERQREYATFFKSYTVIVLNICQNGQVLNPVTEGNMTFVPVNATNRWGFFPQAIKAILALEVRPDLVTAQDMFISGLIGVIAKWRYRVPLNLQLHSDGILKKVWQKQSWENRVLLKLAWWVNSQADSFRYLTERQKRGYQKQFPITKQKYWFQAPVYTDLDFYYRKISLSQKPRWHLISIGRLSWEKNQRLMIESLAEVVKIYPQAQLTIVGDGPERSSLDSLAKSLGVADQVNLVGYLDKAEIQALLYQADLFLLSSYFEGWALVVSEAVAAGVPVVQTKVGSQGELIRHRQTGLIAAASPTAFSKQIIAAWEDYPRTLSYAQAAQVLLFRLYQKKRLIKAWIEGLYATAKR